MYYFRYTALVILLPAQPFMRKIGCRKGENSSKLSSKYTFEFKFQEFFKKLILLTDSAEFAA